MQTSKASDLTAENEPSKSDAAGAGGDAKSAPYYLSLPAPTTAGHR